MAKKTKAGKAAPKGAAAKRTTARPAPATKSKTLRKHSSTKMPVRPEPRPARPTAPARATPPRAKPSAPAPRKAKKAAPAPQPAATASADKKALAARMAAFSEKVQSEEETPVAVRSWSEAKAEKPASRQLLPKTGAVTPADEEDEEEDTTEPTVESPGEAEEGDVDEDDAPAAPREETDEEDEEDDEELPPPSTRPQMNPLTGPLAVPKDRDLEFQVAPPQKIKKAGKGGEKPEEFGPVELRQATASGGRHITRSLPENLQRAADRIQPLASPEAKGKKKTAPERFEVSMDKRAGPKLTDLHDWGDVEIGQQTLSGSRKVGRLTPQEEEEKKRAEEAEKRKK